MRTSIPLETVINIEVVNGDDDRVEWRRVRLMHEERENVCRRDRSSANCKLIKSLSPGEVYHTNNANRINNIDI